MEDHGSVVKYSWGLGADVDQTRVFFTSGHIGLESAHILWASSFVLVNVEKSEAMARELLTDPAYSSYWSGRWCVVETGSTEPPLYNLKYDRPVLTANLDKAEWAEARDYVRLVARTQSLELQKKWGGQTWLESYYR
jgi:hypothetical protein